MTPVIRSNGVGWALGIGRIGSIVGPMMAGVMLSLEWNRNRFSWLVPFRRSGSGWRFCERLSAGTRQPVQTGV